jgi:ketosteroid isomerase-like protein
MEKKRVASTLLVAIGGLLSACTTMVEFRSVPPGAAVTYRGQEIGKTPFTYGVSDQFGWWSTYSFTASADGYAPQTLDFQERTPADAQFIVPDTVIFALAPLPAAAPPAPPPAPVALAAAPPPPPPAPPPPPPDDRPAVQAAVQAWAAAWSGRDLAAYFLAYDPAFAGRFKTHAAWVKDRRTHIVAHKSISVELSDVRVTASGDTAQATFVQRYASGPVKSSEHKTLELRRDGAGKWLIVAESVTP